MVKRGIQTALGVVVILIAIFFIVAVVSLLIAGHDLARSVAIAHGGGTLMAWTGYLLGSTLGLACLGVPALLILAGVSLITRKVRRTTELLLTIAFITLCASALLSLTSHASPAFGGWVGNSIAAWLAEQLGITASYLIISISIVTVTLLSVGMMVIPEHITMKTESLTHRGWRRLLHFFKKGEEIPLLEIGQTVFPWIVKKRIIILETETMLHRPRRCVDDTLDHGIEDIRKPALSEREETPVPLLVNEEPGATIHEDTKREFVLAQDEYIVEDDNQTMPVNGGAIGAGQEKDSASIGDGLMSRNGEILLSECICGDAAAPRIFEGKDTIDVAKEEEKGTRSELEEQVFGEIPINEEYIIPTTYLSSSRPIDSESWKNEIRKNSQLLKATLAEFSIDAEVVNVNRGPVITLYEMQIGPGIKVTRVASLADDIAMALAASRVRIVAPIPGKSAIGVEIPNRFRETVTLGDIVKSKEFKSFEGSLAVALGKDILGTPVLLDLKRLPHLLIAGATGSGKSVCVNAIITSLLYRYDPNYLRFILIDPKMVELQLYNGLPHLLTPVIVDPHMAPVALRWAMYEMERRYRLLSAVHVRDIERYNERVVENGAAERIPYIVIIIDEMADLMMTSKEVEGCITRIAQKARAVGIHLVVATQRPSVDIITGIIKANFPARVAFQVAQKTDSRTIIDQNGAEKLLGRGDMLYQSPTSSFPIRVQGGYVSEEEIERVVAHCKCLGAPSYIDIEERIQEVEESRDDDAGGDELFQEALKIVGETKKASASYLQRRLSIGYNRAARIIEQMEEMGYIGPQVGSKPREVYV